MELQSIHRARPSTFAQMTARFRLLVKQLRLSSPGKTNLHVPVFGKSEKHTGSGVTI